MLDVIRFIIVFALLLFGALDICCAIVGLYRQSYALNRMHFSGMGDSLGIFAVIFGLMIARGISFDSAKLLLVLITLWQTSPIASHLLAKLVYMTDEHIAEHARIPETANAKKAEVDK